MEQKYISYYLLKIAVAFPFIYAGIAGFVEPLSWIGYFPQFIQTIIPGTILIVLWGVVEIGIALWILVGKNIKIPATLATLMLLGVVIFNLSQFSILFRDVSIALISAILVLWNPTTSSKNISE